MRISDWSSDVLFRSVLGTGYAIEKLTAAPEWLAFACYIAAYGFGGWFTVREAIENLKLKRFEIDTLMLVAAAGAAALGAWAEGALLLDRKSTRLNSSH